jgi:hypothetical protein
MKIITGFLLSALVSLGFLSTDVNMKINTAYTVDSLGACQGVSYQQGKIFLYGDREVGVIREYAIDHDSLVYLRKEIKLTIDGKDVIGHPTGLAVHGEDPVFIGNSIRLNPEGTSWKALIYCVDWKGLQKTGTLDGNLLNTIEDDTCIQGCRPEYVQYKNKWYVATADYGEKTNEVRLYDPAVLKTARKTSAKGVLYKKFSCTPWVQNLCWIPDKNLLLLVQNQIEGKKWRFTYVDLAKSIGSGKSEVVKVIDTDRPDELEGYAFSGSLNKGIAVSSSRKKNVTMMDVSW